MKYALLLLISIFSFSCQKAIEKAQEDLIIDDITTGQWRVMSFINGSADVTGDFNNYAFQFKTNNTVDAIKNGNIEKNGAWKINKDTRTIASFFANATHPLILLNGTWNITDTGDNYVIANQTINGVFSNMRLER
jgi:hypothetical protein